MILANVVTRSGTRSARVRENARRCFFGTFVSGAYGITGALVAGNLVAGDVAQHVKSGKLHAVAVSSGKRASSLPDVPTFIESGLSDFEINSWVALLAPAKTPKAILDKLNAELNAVLNDAEVRERLNGMGISATPGTADKFGEEMKRDLARYGQVVKAANIKAE